MGTCTSTIHTCETQVTDLKKNKLTEESHDNTKRTSIATATPTTSFIEHDDPVLLVRRGVLGQRHPIHTPFGQRQLVYADYTASGRFLAPLEDFFADKIAPLYANTHTEASATGAQTTVLREEARMIIAQNVNAPSDKYATLFVGTGCSGAIEKMINVLGFMLPKFADQKWKLSEQIPEEERPVVFIGPFEHHSNELSWRESIAIVVVIPEDKFGCPDMNVLEQMLIKYQNHSIKIGSFSAGSNVTGLRIDTKQMAILLHKYNALAFFDFAGSGAYIDIDVNGGSEEDSMDAIFMSPHKFIGGPGCSGVLIARRKIFDGIYGIETKTPTFAGGGTVTFVGPYGQDYEDSIEAREDAGTPGIVQSIRTGLVFQVKAMVGSKKIEMIERHHCDMVLKQLRSDKNISLTGCDRLAYFDSERRVPIFSFNIITPFDANSQSSKQLKLQVSPTIPEDGNGHDKRRKSMRSSFNKAAASFRGLMDDSGDAQAEDSVKMMLHPSFVVAILNDVYGIQARAGCSCTGPYGHRLFGMDAEDEELPKQIRALTQRDLHVFKPGWARVNFNYFISDEEVDFICDAIRQVGQHGWKLLPFYVQEPLSGLYIHRGVQDDSDPNAPGMVSLADLSLSFKPGIKYPNLPQRTAKEFHCVIQDAEDIYRAAERVILRVVENKNDHSFIDIPTFTEPLPRDIGDDQVWWATPPDVVEYLKNGGDLATSTVHEHMNTSSKRIMGIDNVDVVLDKRNYFADVKKTEPNSLLKIDSALLNSSGRLCSEPTEIREESMTASFRACGLDRGTLFGCKYLAENPNMRSRG